MPSAIDSQVKKQVINQWLSGDSRDRIAADNGIGAGTVSNIINEWKKGVDDSDYDSIRELTVPLKKQGISFNELTHLVRLYNYIKKLGANEDQIESFFANCMNGANSLPPEKIIDLTNQLFDISKSESISPAGLPAYVKQKIEEKQTYEEQIQQAGAILEGKNLDIKTINEYKQLEEELKKHGLSIQDPHILVSVLKTIRHIGYNPQKIVSEFSRIKSIRQTEKRLRANCKIFESRMARCQEVLPMSEQIVRLGIGVPELLALHSAVLKKADTDNLSRDRAAYRVIEEIRDYNNFGGMKKQLSDVCLQIFTMNQISGRQNNAIMALARLHAYGITDDEILNIHEILNRARFESAASIGR